MRKIVVHIGTEKRADGLPLTEREQHEGFERLNAAAAAMFPDATMRLADVLAVTPGDAREEIAVSLYICQMAAPIERATEFGKAAAAAFQQLSVTVELFAEGFYHCEEVKP